MADTAAAPQAQAKLDDVMIAMDVVDTIRHRDDLVRRELDESGREVELIARLREIYRQQGIEVPDSVLAVGVKALKESRFTYRPAPGGWKRTVFTAWTRRRLYGRIGAVVLALATAGWGAHYAWVERPAQLAAEADRIELTERLPKLIRQAHADVAAVATDPAAKARADQLLADGERAIRYRDRGAMARFARDLAQLRETVVQEYTLTIVSRPGETSGVWRRPPRKAQARNYYLVVEAVAPDGRKLSLPILNEETGTTEVVAKFAVRVPQATFEAVAADKRDDGIIQKSRVGTKKRGKLAPDFEMPFEGGMITRW